MAEVDAARDSNEATGWHRQELVRGTGVQITVDGIDVVAYEGETLAAAMLAAGCAFDVDVDGEPRAPLCNMGTCFECVATVDGRPLSRTCLTPVREGQQVHTGQRN